MMGHAASNIVPVVAANRIGTEEIIGTKENNHQNSKLDFYGSSFITDETGAIVEEANRKDEAILLHEFDLDAIDEMRMSWGIFRDRRPECYDTIVK